MWRGPLLTQERPARLQKTSHHFTRMAEPPVPCVRSGTGVLREDTHTHTQGLPDVDGFSACCDTGRPTVASGGGQQRPLVVIRDPPLWSVNTSGPSRRLRSSSYFSDINVNTRGELVLGRGGSPALYLERLGGTSMTVLM
ncbi:uncharacterized protein [Panulirus ornatus]|uniref:uncharacterized protein n=1 Tax=Panulirus ornatus TaxID=150431 RepID=UPI003A888E2F